MGIPDQIMPETQLQIGPSAGLSEVNTPEQFGSGVGQSVSRLGEVETRLWHDANASAVTRAHNDVDAASNDLLYNRQSGLLYQNLGEHAPPAVDKASADYTVKVSEARGLLTNDAQRMMFDHTMAQHGMQYRRTLSEYEHKQVTAGQNAQTQAFIQNRQTDIAQNYDKPAIVASNIAQQRYALVQAYARNTSGDPVALQAAVDAGKAPDELTQILAKRTSDAHMTALDTMLANQQNQMGKAYFEAHKQDLDAQDLDRATRMVKAGTDSDQARSIANEIIGNQMDSATDILGVEDKSRPTLEAALDDLEKKNIQDTHVYDDAQNRIVHHFRLMGEAHKEAQGQLLEQATEAVDDPENMNRTIPANVMGQLDTRGREAVMLYRDKMLKEGRIKTDEGTRLRLREAAADPDQWDSFAAEKPELYKGLLNDVDYRNYENAIAHVKGQISKRDTRLSQGMVSTQIAKRIFNENGLEIPSGAKPGTPVFEAAAARQNRFMDQLHRAVAADSLSKKRELTEEEIGTHASRLFATQSWVTQEMNPYGDSSQNAFGKWLGKLRPSFLSSTDQIAVTHSAPAFEAPFADKIAYSTKDIPAAELQKLLESGKRKGYQRSEQELVADYNDMIARSASATP